MAAVDVIQLVADFASQAAPVAAVGLLVLLCHTTVKGLQAAREALGFVGASAGASEAVGSGGGLDAVYARAAAMAAAGEGQSEDFRHNTATAAYDAGYTGKRIGDTVDPAAYEAFRQGMADREQDKRGG